ncbi:hypothetical protein ACFQDG_01150 [Natronoarchaeum mannanilyticum]|uniref:DUF7344 domain-containing protein n=1 Tax=Natronoarchaeum mannanilyticum TaxID=926360 RepID=A0AAV3TDR5_9EURY
MSLLDRLQEAVSQQPQDEPASASIPRTEVYSLLQNERRRHIIRYLAEHDDDEVAVSEIADHLAELGDDRTNCYVSAIQQHCPRMSPSVVEFDEQSKSVRIRPELYVVADVMEAVEETLD